MNAQAPTYLYGGQASKLEGDVKKRGGDNFGWKGSGALTWEVQIAKSGEYSVSLCHAAEPDAVGQPLQIRSGLSRLSYELAMTQGVFGNKSYALAPIQGSLRLAAGTNTITLSITNAPAGKPILAFRSLELTPLSAQAAIEADRQEARRSRASTGWLSQAGYGLMFHWTSQSIGTDGAIKPFDQAVADFPLERFVEMVTATGAGYVLFTIGHAQAYCPAPLSSWEKYHPGKTTKRDLIAEMAQALNAKGIKLMCYFPTHVIGNNGVHCRKLHCRI
ncbi:MAG: alpha-L-fucosidase [Limisphaerales bacterium]